MKIKNLLLQPGNISILGHPGTGKTTLLKLIVEEAITLNEYDKIIVYSLPVNNNEWSEYKKDKKFKIVDSKIPTHIFKSSEKLRKLIRSNKSYLVVIDGLENFLREIIDNRSVRMYREVSISNNKYPETQIIQEKSDSELAIEFIEREIRKYPLSKTKLCISNYRKESNLDISIAHEIQFDNLKNYFSELGDFKYTTKHNLGSYIEKNREDYWGDYEKRNKMKNHNKFVNWIFYIIIGVIFWGIVGSALIILFNI